MSERRFLITLVTLLVMGVGLIIIGSAEARGAVTCMPVNHRGYHNSVIPEESAASFDKAPAGTWQELDLQVATDSTLWLMHDDNVRRTTHVNGRIWDHDAAWVGALRYPDGSGVLGLRDALVLAKRTHHPVLVEFKRYGQDAWTGPEIASAVQLIRDSGYARHVFATGTDGFLRLLSTTYEDVRVAWRPDHTDDPTSDPYHASAVFVYPEDLTATMASSIVSSGRIAGTRNTLNSEVAGVLEKGVTHIQTNHPRAVQRECENYG